MLFLDGIYVDTEGDKCGQRFLRVKNPSAIEMNQLTKKIGLRIARYLERAKLIERDAENCYLADGALGDNEIATHQGHSIQYRIAVGPHAGKKVFALKTLPSVSHEIQNDVLGKGCSCACAESESDTLSWNFRSPSRSPCRDC